MSASGEKKPSVPSSHVTLKIKKNQDDNCVYIRTKRDVGLHTMMKAFSHSIGEDTSSFVFCFDGIRIKPYQTPNELELEDGDEIDAFGRQLGGFSFYRRHCH